MVDGGIIGTNVEYFENTGDDAAPDFVYVESYPFGIPQLQSPQMDPFEFIDIDGDGDPDIFLHYQGLETPLAFLENTGTPGAPWFGDSQVEFAPFGFMAPLSDSVPGSTLGNSIFSFVDIDADNDYDLFFGGHFLQNGDTVLDENLYFYRNEDNSGKGTAPHFAPPEKNPFHLSRPLVPDGLLIPGFVDIDCDGDWDLFETYANIGITFLENTGTPISPDFNKPPVAWWANDPPPPPGYDSYALGDWIDIGGDGDMDYIGGSVPGFFFWENVSNNAMACRGYLPEITSFRDAHLDASLTLYPNPAQDMLAFDLQSYDPIGEINIEIFNVLAQRVRNLHRPGFANALQETISLESLADGIYTIRLSSGGKFIVQQFVKIR